MKYLLNIGMILILMVLVSCQKEDNITTGVVPDTSTGKVAVKLNAAMNGGVYNSTGYEPMGNTRLNDDTSVLISNDVEAFILKKVGTKWIVDSIIQVKIDESDKWNSNNYRFYQGDNVLDREIMLRPGTYRISVFTTVYNMTSMYNSQDLLHKVVYDENNPDLPKTPLYTYALNPKTYLRPGERYLSLPVYAGITEEFTITKANDVHSNPVPENVSVQLKRKTGKIRILLKDDPAGSYRFDTQNNNAIVAAMIVDGDGEFCYGLDIFTEPYYKPEEKITEMFILTWTPTIYLTGNDGYRYLCPVIGLRESGHNYFTDPDVDLNLIIDYVDISTGTASNKQYFGNDIPLQLKHNTVTGIIFRPGIKTGLLGRYDELFLVEDANGPVSSADIFPLNQEDAPY